MPTDEEIAYDINEIMSYGFDIKFEVDSNHFHKKIGKGITVAGMYSERKKEYYLTIFIEEETAPLIIKESRIRVQNTIDERFEDEKLENPFKKICEEEKKRLGIPDAVDFGDLSIDYSNSISIEGKDFNKLYTELKSVAEKCGIYI